MSLTKPSFLKYSALFMLIVSSLSFLGSCKKFSQQPKVEITSSQIQDNGDLYLFAEVVSGIKTINRVGFCWGTSSQPVADINSSMMVNTVVSNIDNENFSATIPGVYFESYTGYYIRPFAQTQSGVIYGQEVYLESVGLQPVTPTCTPTDNYVNTGLSFQGPQVFSQVSASNGVLSSYHIRAWKYSNQDELEFEFKRKPKTGIYKTSSYASEDNSKVNVILNSGSISKNLESGYPIYINEVEKDKFEITMCSVPWKFSGSTTLQLTTKIIVN